MATFLITGASRGLGLALARELASLPASEVSKVIASARGDAPALDKLAQTSSGRVVVVKLDVTDQASIKKAAAEIETKLGGKGLNVLINNAGICQHAFEGVKSMSACLPNIYQEIDRLNILRGNLEESFTVNVMGVHWVTREFLPLLQKGTLKKVANMQDDHPHLNLFLALT